MRILRHLWTTEDDAPEVRTSYQYLFEVKERLEETLRIAREELGKAQVRQKRYYDRKAEERSLEVGDKVLLLRPTDSNKLIMQWKGPYQVEAKRSDNDYRINVEARAKLITLICSRSIRREPRMERWLRLSTETR